VAFIIERLRISKSISLLSLVGYLIALSLEEDAHLILFLTVIPRPSKIQSTRPTEAADMFLYFG
jgi:hypothetical protein